MLVIYLVTLISNLVLRHISPIFFKYSWDWGGCQLNFRLSISLGLPMIYDIRPFLHGLVEIEMDRIKFHLRSIDGFFSRMFMWQFVFIIFTLQIGLSRWAVSCALWDLFLDELRCTHFEIQFKKFSNISSHDPELFFLFMTQSHFFFPFRALSSRPRVVFLI